MKFCIYGAGAIGSYLAVELALAGHAVSVIARGPHLEAIRARGLTLRIDGGERTARIPASDKASDFGPQDYVLCSLMAHQAFAAAPDFAPLLGPETAVVTAMNGIPWWYFHGEGGPFEGRHLDAVDPGGRQWRAIGPERAIGCVVDPACEIVEPGIVAHNRFKKFHLGEPDGSESPRVIRLAQILEDAGFEAPVRRNIRWNVWLKLWGNVCFSPVSALTGASLDRVATEPALSALCLAVMEEARIVALRFGIEIDASMAKRRLAAAGEARGHKISMLQDLERGRSLELDAIVAAVQEMGRLVGVATPQIDALLALTQEVGRQAKLYTPLKELPI